MKPIRVGYSRAFGLQGVSRAPWMTARTSIWSGLILYDSVRAFDHFTDLGQVDFGDSPTRHRKLSDLRSTLRQAIDYPSRVSLGVLGNIGADGAQVLPSRERPVNFHVGNPNSRLIS
jgi:hypothetical protein